MSCKITTPLFLFTMHFTFVHFFFTFDSYRPFHFHSNATHVSCTHYILEDRKKNHNGVWAER